MHSAGQHSKQKQFFGEHCSSMAFQSSGGKGILGTTISLQGKGMAILCVSLCNRAGDCWKAMFQYEWWFNYHMYPFNLLCFRHHLWSILLELFLNHIFKDGAQFHFQIPLRCGRSFLLPLLHYSKDYHSLRQEISPRCNLRTPTHYQETGVS